MKKFRKKPVIVEAFKFNISKLPWPSPVGDSSLDGSFSSGPVIFTLEGKMKVSDGDYIIKGIKGEYYPCKPDIFEMTYEELDG